MPCSIVSTTICRCLARRRGGLYCHGGGGHLMSCEQGLIQPGELNQTLLVFGHSNPCLSSCCPADSPCARTFRTVRPDDCPRSAVRDREDWRSLRRCSAP